METPTDKDIEVVNAPEVVEVEETKEERDLRLSEEERILVEQIKTATGHQLFQFMVRFKGKIGQGVVGRSKYFDLCMDRARELNFKEVGDWDKAKREIDALYEPSLFATQNMLPVLGFDCKFYMKPDGKKEVAIFNDKTGQSYSHIFTGRVWEKTAKTVFE
jgi:hypothetical protein